GLAVVGQERLSLPPELMAATTTVALNQAVALSKLFSVRDPLDRAIVDYSVRDPAGGGSVILNGAADLASASEHAQGVLVFAAPDSAITEYKFRDPAGGGKLLLNGATDLATAQQQVQGISIVSALDLARLQYATGATTGSETLLISAFDGNSWGTANIAVNTVD